MNKILFVIGLGGSLLLTTGCSDQAGLVIEDAEQTPLAFTASGVDGNAARATFPQPSIAVLATKTETATTADNSSGTATLTPDWSSLYLLDHAPFSVGTEDSNGKYAVTSSETYYWPFEANQYLSFVAYSPVVEGTLSKNATTTTTLDVAATVDNPLVDNPFPDLLYTQPVGAFNKKHGTVDLGEFCHAMARVRIEVIPVDKEGAVIEDEDYTNDLLRITSLKLETKQTKGSFNLINSEWTLGAADGGFTSFYTLINNTNGVKLPYRSADASTYYLLPSTDLDNSQVTISLMDGDGGVLKTDYTKLLSEFKETVDGKEKSAELVAGKTTLLTIYVKTMKVNTGDQTDIILTGTLTDWDYKGEGELTIE